MNVLMVAIDAKAFEEGSGFDDGVSDFMAISIVWKRTFGC